MSIVLRSPYHNAPLPWLKGNLHTHTGNSDGPGSPQGIVDEYAARGYDFLMISDHDCFTDPSGLDARGLTLLPGNEVTAGGPHVLHVAAESAIEPDPDRQKVLDLVAAQGGLSILCHPNWERHFNHCPQEQLEAWRGYAGIEIYNGVVAWLEGSPLATDRWDRLLGQGRQVWGFANDDTHLRTDISVAWNVVQSERRDVAAIVEALREGRFYASTGVAIDRIQVHGSTLGVFAAGAESISVFSDFGFRRAIADAPQLTFTVPDDAPYTYVRVECAGLGEQRAWTQPILIERGGD